MIEAGDRAAIHDLLAEYGALLDAEKYDEWLGLFAAECRYNVMPRENYDRGLPVGLIYCENKRMIHDRAFALMETSMFAPRYLRHIIANQVVVSVESNGTIKSRANYVVLQVLFDRPDATLHQVGVYYDVFRRVGGELKLAERRCVYDNLLVSNALCIPV